MKRFYQTNNYWRFTWRRQPHDAVLLRSLPTGLLYSWSVSFEARIRSAIWRRIRQAARKAART
jgi:hypothetical protein